jgi:hypothetical protein
VTVLGQQLVDRSVFQAITKRANWIIEATLFV